uniref:Crossover junction endonuclease MUS81 n=1 Tax=Trypanosoma congolense (strain IL3000) TaxID=1068625 RepID=G0USS3_TRYCI|nr:putative DNA repair protein [Trypanosoma congolense IL3000]
MSHTHNEGLASYVEQLWPQRYAAFCAALRRHPLPVCCGAAVTWLDSSSPEVVRAAEAYCCGVAFPCSAGPLNYGCVPVEGELPMQSGVGLHAMLRESGTLVFSPFRCFKVRCIEVASVSAALPPCEGRSLTSMRPGRPRNPRGGVSVSSVNLTYAGRPPDLVRHGERCTGKRPRECCTSQCHPQDETSSLPPQVSIPLSGLFPLKPQQDNVKSHSNTVSPVKLTLTVSEVLEHGRRLRTPFRSPVSAHIAATESSEPVRNQPARLVGNPREFVASLEEAEKTKRRLILSSAAASPTRACGTEADQECSSVSWHLLVDNRERIKGAHENLIDAFERAGVPTLSCVLPCGDFMIGVNASTELSPWELQRTCLQGGYDETVTSSSMESSWLPTLQISFIVVERKTVKDLCASIASSRYYEQRYLLSNSPFRSVVWVVEGTMDSLRDDEQRRAYSACASLATLSSFRIVRTRHLSETITFLRSLGNAFSAKISKSIAEYSTNGLTARCAACFRHTSALRKNIQARTTFARMLMCIRGCSSTLAAHLAVKYGSLLHLWRQLKDCGREACDADEEICHLGKLHKEVCIHLTEFLLAREYS